MTEHKLFEVDFKFYKSAVCGGDAKLTTVAIDAADAIEQVKYITQERFGTPLDNFESRNVKYIGKLHLSRELNLSGK